MYAQPTDTDRVWAEEGGWVQVGKGGGMRDTCNSVNNNKEITKTQLRVLEDRGLRTGGGGGSGHSGGHLEGHTGSLSSGKEH